MDEQIASPFSRRQLIAATVSGTLLGSAWAMAFRETTSQDGGPAVTVARNTSSLAALIEHDRKRLLLLDSPSAPSARALSELVTGFTRQRIDVLLATSETIANISRDFKSRWMISEVFALPDTDRYPSMALDGREIQVAELRIMADRVVSREWRRDSYPEQSPWQLTARYRSSRIVIASSPAVFGRLTVEPGIVTCVICNDAEISKLPGTLPAGAVAVPSDAVLFNDRGGELPESAVPLHVETPQTFRMTDAGIVLPVAL